jgi:hypothetical protein
MDSLPDGRLIVAGLNGNNAELWLEDGVGTRQFVLVETVAPPANDPVFFTLPAFVSVSKNTSGPVRVALGNNNNSFGVFELTDVGQAGTLSVAWHQTSDQQFIAAATWFDNNQLAVGSSDFANSKLTVFDFSTSLSAPTESPVIAGPNLGATGGIAFLAGDLYYGNGFDFDPLGGPETGEIRKFAAADWQAAIGGTALSYASDGELIATILTAASLGFDVEGNLLVGGGVLEFQDPDPRNNYLSIVDLLPGGGIVERLFDPDLSDVAEKSAYSLVFNPVTGEILAVDPFSAVNSQTVFIIGVPEPSALLLMLSGAVALVARRRRPHSSLQRG